MEEEAVLELKKEVMSLRYIANDMKSTLTDFDIDSDIQYQNLTSVINSLVSFISESYEKNSI
tara:strand:- start:102 stop:287 length:186 start_codon:yes stop_codon:yes gene_type:complete